MSGATFSGLSMCTSDTVDTRPWILSSASAQNTVSSTTISITRGAVAVGDIAITIISGSSATGTFSVPVNWVKLVDTGTTFIIYRAFTASSVSSVATYTRTTADVFGGTTIIIRGGTFHAVSQSSIPANPILLAPSIEVPLMSSLLLVVYTVQQAAGVTFSTPTGTTQVVKNTDSYAGAWAVYSAPEECGVAEPRVSSIAQTKLGVNAMILIKPS